jgi:pathogenesis-related protein 1
VRQVAIVSLTLLLTACGGSSSSSSNPPVTTATTANTAPSTVPLTPAAEPATMTGMLDTHNQVRAAVGVMPLTWSSQMSSYAQEWANYLANNNGCKMQHRSAAGTNTLGVGENLYWASPVTWTDGRTEVQAITPTQVANDWASEKPDYDYASNTCASGKICGHYTQMVWRTTTEVGCGMTICPDKGQIWVCNYNPPGNWVGQKPY